MATNTHSEFVTLIAFPRQQWLANAPEYYVVPTLAVLLLSEMKWYIATLQRACLVPSVSLNCTSTLSSKVINMAASCMFTYGVDGRGMKYDHGRLVK
jgi:hypothetical protein